MKYIITSTEFKGEIVCVFNSRNRLAYFDIRALLTDEQHQYFVYGAPMTVAEIDKLRGKRTTITQVKIDLSFEAFWDAYNYKEGVKKDAIAMWNRMSERERIAAIEYIRIYDGILAQRGIAKAYPTKYLSKKYWEVDHQY